MTENLPSSKSLVATARGRWYVTGISQRWTPSHDAKLFFLFLQVVVVLPKPCKYPSILVGGGPSGIAVLLSAHRDGVLRDLLLQGLLIVERSATLGVGQIGDYVINSDSTGATFLDPLRSAHEPKLRCILDSPVARRIASAEQAAVPLRDVGELMALIGAAFVNIIQDYPRSRILTSCTAISAEMLPGGNWRLDVADQREGLRSFEAVRLVLATGASQPGSRLQGEHVAGQRVSQRWGQRLLQSGEVLSRGGMGRVAELLRDKPAPKVAILGGSTSALAVAHALLHRLPGVTFKAGGITVLHRKPLRVYYTSADEAIADGYEEFGPDDLCPITRRVFRFAGLRLDSRELLMQIRGIGGRCPEPRIALHQLQGEDAGAVERIDAADIVVAAFGYRPNALPLLDHRRRPIQLFANTTPSAPLVDAECRVLNANGLPIPNVYGIGLAAGYRPRGKFGGEPSFTGQANGLWLWQSGIGSIIAKALLAAPQVSASPLKSRRFQDASARSVHSLKLPLARTA